MADDFRDRFRAAYQDCTDTVFWHSRRTPAEVLDPRPGRCCVALS